MSKQPKAVLISDIHFTVATLELATASLKSAIARSQVLRVPLIIAGDTLDAKAIMRGEVVNRLIDIFQTVDKDMTYLMVGNHDLINEKGTEHTLNFLKPYCTVVDGPQWDATFAMVPYHHDMEELENLLRFSFHPGSTLIMHQGVQTAHMGHYTQDKSSLPPEAFADFRVISGHYHRSQDIKCGRPRKGGVGLFSYIGNPYSLNFGEAEDGPKGFKVLYDDGSLELVELPLRKHVVIKATASRSDLDAPIAVLTYPIHDIGLNDLVWVKVLGSRSVLDGLTKSHVAVCLNLPHQNFKLDKIPTDEVQLSAPIHNLTDAEVMDSIIDNSAEPAEQKKKLKALWRSLV